MKDSNKCEAPLGGGGIDVCDKFDRFGKHSVGIGKAVADVTYYNKSQGEGNTWTYACCKECASYYSYLVDSDDWEDNTVVKIQYYSKEDSLGNVDHMRGTILVSDQ